MTELVSYSLLIVVSMPEILIKVCLKDWFGETYKNMS